MASGGAARETREPPPRKQPKQKTRTRAKESGLRRTAGGCPPHGHHPDNSRQCAGHTRHVPCGQVFWLPGHPGVPPSRPPVTLTDTGQWLPGTFVTGYSGASAADFHGLPSWFRTMRNPQGIQHHYRHKFGVFQPVHPAPSILVKMLGVLYLFVVATAQTGMSVLLWKNLTEFRGNRIRLNEPASKNTRRGQETCVTPTSWSIS